MLRNCQNNNHNSNKNNPFQLNLVNNNNNNNNKNNFYTNKPATKFLKRYNCSTNTLLDHSKQSIVQPLLFPFIFHSNNNTINNFNNINKNINKNDIKTINNIIKNLSQRVNMDLSQHVVSNIHAVFPTFQQHCNNATFVAKFDDSLQHCNV